MKKLLCAITASRGFLILTASAQASETSTEAIPPVNQRHACQAELDGSGSFFSFHESTYPKNREQLLDQCDEHAGNTCCTMKHIDQITAKINFISQQTEHPVSDRCKIMTKSVYCSICDGDVGTQRRRGLCENVCQQWYQACQDDYICELEDGTLDFCNVEEVPQAVRLRDLLKRSESSRFCGQMGFKVFEPPACYNGEPLASTLRLQANNFQKRTNRGIVAFSFTEMISGLVNVIWSTPKALTILCVIAAALISCLFGIYSFNVWQLERQELAAIEADKQRRRDKVNERRRLRREERLIKQLAEKEDALREKQEWQAKHNTQNYLKEHPLSDGDEFPKNAASKEKAD